MKYNFYFSILSIPLCILFFLSFLFITLRAQNAISKLPSKGDADIVSITYKTIDTLKLDLIFRYPTDFDNSKQYPTIIFFFGGGWNGGSTSQFAPHSQYFASRGLITVLADYRVKSRHKTTPFESVSDAKSAVRFLRQYAQELKIDTDKIIASGGSAGGHLAAACGAIEGLDEPYEDLNISSKANALVLFNPVFDNGPNGFEHKRMGDRWSEISPIHNIKKGAPPTIIFFGTEDEIFPASIAQNYKSKMDSVGSRCDLFLYKGQKHGFFNRDRNNGIYYDKTIRETDLFLQSLGYLDIP